MKKIILSSLVLLGMSGAAFAQGTTDFATLDTDLNGELSYTELQVAWPDLTQDEFNTADADMSGGVSSTELTALQPAAEAPAANAAPAPADTAPADTLSGASSEAGEATD